MKKILGLVCIILGIGLAIVMFRQESSATSNDKGNKLTRHSAPVVLFGLGLRLLLAGGSAGSISLSLPKRSGGRDIAAGLPGNAAPRGGQNTFATNPARLDLNYFHWLTANPRHIAFHAIAIIGGLALLLVKWQAGAVLLAAAGLTLWRTRRDMHGKFFRGDVCPGVVLSAETGLVAVLTDLKAATNVARPAIKILKQPLSRIKIYTLQEGMRVATVAEYYGQPQETTWKNFFPEVIPCSVHDEAENQRILDSIPEEQWQALDAALARIPSTNPGLYRLWGDNLAADTRAAVPWLQRSWVRIGLIAFASFGLLFLAMQAWSARQIRLREQQAQTDLSRVNSGTNPTTSTHHRPTLELNGKLLTFTNTLGGILKDITLVRADEAMLTYQKQTKEEKIPLAIVPVEIQDQLEIPHDWHGYRAALNTAGQLPAPGAFGRHETTAPRPQAPTSGAYQPGQKIYALWAGRWLSGTIIEPFGMGLSYRVQLADPRFQRPMVLSTNLLRPQ